MTDNDETPRDNKGERHGYWVRYKIDGSIYHKATYIHGDAVGYSEWNWARDGEKNTL